ncbi:MAG TPA: VOC family protein [Dinghuibacter sp.]|uniref:VOC family protein n=1 Tax=Dinghuibacter sp. TaxID=2024697 RepID=UPI002BC9841C|nr:VOC family protein [Dinghuibacter sp.]HTJ12665.1 VOC family protein [Dinghuibacter sp.]
MMQIHPYIHFNGRCREAMTFYKESLGAELEMAPAEEGGRIVHASLVKDDLLLMGSDMQGPGAFARGNGISLSLSCGSEADIRLFFRRLSTGGTVVSAVMAQQWGGLFGVVTDRFGITWMLSYDAQARL